MNKLIKDIKVNDILWLIAEGDRPQLLPLIIINIELKKLILTECYNLTVRFPDGSDKYISLFNDMKRDYDNPLLTDLLPTLKYDWDDEISNDIIKGMICFDKDNLWKHYVNELENNIKYVEEVIERGKQNLKYLNEKLQYIKKQYE